MKCPICEKEAFLVCSYVKRNAFNKHIKEVYPRKRKTQSVMLKEYECCNGHGKFLYKPDSPFPDKYAFGIDRPSFELFNFRIDWLTKEEWTKLEKT